MHIFSRYSVTLVSLFAGNVGEAGTQSWSIDFGNSIAMKDGNEIIPAIVSPSGDE